MYISVTALDINSPEHVEFDLSSGRFYCELHSAAEEEEGDEGHRGSQVWITSELMRSLIASYLLSDLLCDDTGKDIALRVWGA